MNTALQHFKTLFPRENRWHLLALVGVIIIGVGIRLHYLSLPMRGDEGKTFVDFAQHPLSVALSSYSAPNNHLFHTLLVHLSYRVFGDHLWAIRLPAFLAGVLLIPAVYLVGRALYNSDAALLSAGLTAGFAPLIHYSTDARGYTIAILLFLLLLRLALALMRRQSFGVSAAFAILSALMVYTIIVMVEIVPIAAVWLALCLWIEQREGERWRELRAVALILAAGAALTLLLYLPVLLNQDIASDLTDRYEVDYTRSLFISEARSLASAVLTDWHRDMPGVVAFVLGAGFVVGTIAHRRLSLTAVPPGLVAIVGFGAALVFHGLLGQEFPRGRIWNVLLPLYLLTLSAGLVYLLRLILARRERWQAAIVALTTVIAAVGLSALVVQNRSIEDANVFHEAEQVALFLQPRLQTGDIVLNVPGTGGLSYYFNHYGLDDDLLKNTNRPPASRLFVIVLTGQTLDEVLHESDVQVDDYSIPELLTRFTDVAIYTMRQR